MRRLSGKEESIGISNEKDRKEENKESKPADANINRDTLNQQIQR